MNPPPEKSIQKFLGLPFCCTVEHVQLKNVTVDMIIVRSTVGLKCAPECIKITVLKEKIQKIDPIPTGREIPPPSASVSDCVG